MQKFYCGIYDPALSKQYMPVVSIKLSMKSKAPQTDDAIEAVFVRVKDSQKFKRVGTWDQDSIKLWKLNEPMTVPDWENNRNPLVGAIENHATYLSTSTKLSMSSVTDDNVDLLDFVVVLESPESEEMLDPVHDLMPRNFQETLSEVLRGPTPSQQAKSTGYKDHQSKQRPIFDGRYDVDHPQNTEGLPIALYHPVFSQFRTEFANVDLPVPQDVSRATMKVVEVSSAIYTGSRKGDKRRRENLVPHLSAAIGHSLEHIVNIDGTEPDGTIVHRPVHAEGESVALSLSEIKDEIGTGGSDPSIQGGLSVRHFWAQKNRANYRNAACCPTPVLAVAGPWIGVLGAVFTDKLIIEPLTDLIRVVDLHLNSPHYRRIARLFHVFGNCLTSLANYWDTLVIPTIPVTSMEHPRYYPHVKGYTSNNSTTSSISPPNRSTRYPLSHRILANADLAPKLLYHGPIDSSADAPSYGSLCMVVMEGVEGTNAFVRYQGRKAPESFVTSVREAILKLHEHDFVFGDLRRQNIMLTRDDKVKLIDFDWAGKDGEAEYPMRPSEKIRWAPGVGAMEKLHKAHDMFMIDKLFYEG
ncbi:uncharacterized protein EV420DRAFT_1302561 [Desarmillaria tabescens]|uniref:Protein kinase domain-containing protein n=1 Tax=Armillaria tabescens TaxID=1929756 RepID=A0AA39TRR0_ARMTA|nr:uncharacterized protein EV420DRAFT_1302561 [Desarmillaria tabescens]KAK0464293.1 hypothetical protein EV420DRAFT_1302561 [Desarmillaria tabescens]